MESEKAGLRAGHGNVRLVSGPHIGEFPHRLPSAVISVRTAPSPGNNVIPVISERRGHYSEPPASAHHPAPNRVQNEFRGIVDVELLQDVRTVRFHGGRADRENLGDFLAATAFCDQLQHLPLSFR